MHNALGRQRMTWPLSLRFNPYAKDFSCINFIALMQLGDLEPLSRNWLYSKVPVGYKSALSDVIAGLIVA
jgi:hypothetical protein